MESMLAGPTFSSHSQWQAFNPNGFLPGFLMGDYSVPLSTIKSSPSSLSTQGSQSGANFISSYRKRPSSDEKTSGPPVTGLFTPQRGSQKRRNLISSCDSQGYSSQSQNDTGVPYTWQLGLSNDETTSKKMEEGCTWVTVFGFPPSSLSFILSQFSQCGSILLHKSSASGNWVHLKYQSKMQANKALGWSGKIFGGTLMIGVVPCSDPELTGSSEELLCTTIYQGLSTVPIGHEYVCKEKSSPQMRHSKCNSINYNKDVIKNAPSRNEGVVNKAIELIFGW